MLASIKTERGIMSKTILIIDDSPSIRQMVAFTLKSEGYTVIEAADGVEGLTEANAHDIDLVLTDQNMPNMDGITFIKKLRGLPKYGTTPILMLTTVHIDEKKTEGKEAGATGWLVKPFDPHKLLEVVNKFLG
jgi:two-component system, chemotaxis family, chemotaxis protein CheY